MHSIHDIFIAGTWQAGGGNSMSTVNPATGTQVWQGHAASSRQVTHAIAEAREAFGTWMSLTLADRVQYLERFTQILSARQKELIEALAQETGKPLWEAKTEIAAIIGKLDISKQAYAERCKPLVKDMQGVTSITRHKPHGVIVVIGPFNFPGHLPNGHIIPALLAGNTIVFKPSELTVNFSIKMLECWQQAELPSGVINMVLGGGAVGQELCENPIINGIFFTGSYATGQKIQAMSGDFPQRIVALEMGGNNPLVVYKPEDIDAAVYFTIQSAFITAGQRCTCARRLIVSKDHQGEKFVQRLIEVTKNIRVGANTESPEPFMGPVISNAAAEKIISSYQHLLKEGAKILVPLQRLNNNLPLLTPGILDVSHMQTKHDEEIFGPLLQLTWVHTFNDAVEAANNTSYGLVAGLISADHNLYNEFIEDIRCGVVSWNRPTTGASSSAPFGGVGKSGNYRPSAYYAADYCSYPQASLEDTALIMPQTLSPGITL